MCNREYFGAVEELKELNGGLIDEVKTRFAKDAKLYLHKEFMKTFKGNKHIKIK